MLMILLFSLSAKPFVIGCFTKRSTPSRGRWILRATCFTGVRRERIAHCVPLIKEAPHGGPLAEGV